MKKKNERMERISTISNSYSQLPDGAYFSVMAEHGITIEDLEEYSDWCRQKRRLKL